jgi:SAM-dependent methyltransferase
MFNNYAESTYGENVAEVYDEWYTDFDPQAVTTLADLAGGGRALELGIGTGRIALPLYQAGVEVHGIDASPAMINKLKSKPGGEEIQIHQGNFADVAVEGEFDLIYIVFNTFFALTTQEQQVRCFANAANHLSPNGTFLVKAFVPDMARYDREQTVRVNAIEEKAVRLETSQIDPVLQQITSQTIFLTEAGIRMYPVMLRYAWPAELDLMAELAGLTLRHRWGNWQKDEFNKQSSFHISVYGLA